MYIRLHNTAEYFKCACKVSQGASTLFKVRQVMQEPFEASLSALVFIAMSDTETASVPHASLETSNAGDSAQLSAPSSDTSLSNAETLRLFSQLLDAKFDQKFAAFKRDLEDKEATTQSQLKKLKIESKATNSFTFKGNKVQYELNISLHDLVDGAIKNISKGNLSAAISELESVKTLITKRNKLIRFADKSSAGWTAVEEYESDELAEDSDDERKLHSAERRALAKIREKRRTSSARPSYTSTRQPSSEVSSVGPSNTFPVNQQLFRGQSFRERRPQPSDKCFSCEQRGHWANSTSCPSRLRGTVAVPSSSKAAN